MSHVDLTAPTLSFEDGWNRQKHTVPNPLSAAVGPDELVLHFKAWWREISETTDTLWLDLNSPVWVNAHDLRFLQSTALGHLNEVIREMNDERQGVQRNEPTRWRRFARLELVRWYPWSRYVHRLVYAHGPVLQFNTAYPLPQAIPEAPLNELSEAQVDRFSRVYKLGEVKRSTPHRSLAIPHLQWMERHVFSEEQLLAPPPNITALLVNARSRSHES